MLARLSKERNNGGRKKQFQDQLVDYTAVSIEAKLATCTAADRYSGDYEKIRGYLEDKLVRTKSVNQLLNAVKRVRAKGADVTDYFKGITEIIPVISTGDDFGGCLGINAYLNKRFNDQLSTESHDYTIVVPLVSMNILCLRRMMWVLQEKSFAEVMKERVENDPTLRHFRCRCEVCSARHSPKAPRAC